MSFEQSGAKSDDDENHNTTIPLEDSDLSEEDLDEVDLSDSQHKSFLDQSGISREQNANLFSRLFFIWSDATVRLGAKRPLTPDDLGTFPPHLTSTASAYRLITLLYGDAESTRTIRSLWYAMWLFIRRGFFFCIFLGMVGGIRDVLGPIFLRYLLESVQQRVNPEQKLSRVYGPYDGWILAVSWFLVNLIGSYACQHLWWRGFNNGLSLRMALNTIVLRKIMRCSPAAKAKATTGQMMNLVAVDTWNMWEWIWDPNNIFLPFFLITGNVVFLSSILGWTIVGIIALCLTVLVPVNALVSRINLKATEEVIRFTDERISKMGQLLHAMGFVKLYNWEEAFRRRISAVRLKETKLIKKLAFLRCGTLSLWTFTPPLISLVTFYFYTKWGGELTPAIAFSVMAAIQNTREPMEKWLQGIYELTSAYISAKRIDQFLKLEEVDDVEQVIDERRAVNILSGYFSWNLQTHENALRDINLEVPHGQLLAVVGPVGSGKSSLVSSLIGEIKKRSGEIRLGGKIVYTSQQAWLMNATVRDNILFGQPYDRHRYERVIEACCLATDMEHLPSGDMSEIGEKGINLSGGQKHRISLARAVYQDVDIYVFDEPLGAVDTAVAKWIFEECIEKFLAGKTRILVTHQLQFLPSVDSIAVMSKGQIAHRATYQQLMSAGIDFSSIVEHQNARLRQQQPDAEKQETKKTENVQKKKKGKKEKGKLTSDEKKSEGAVGLHVYLDYISAAKHGKTLFSFAMVAFVSAQVAKILSDSYLTKWSNDLGKSEDAVDSSGISYLHLFALYIGVHCLLVLVREILLATAILRTSFSLHDSLLLSILRAKMAFFDTTPIGRILNRFSGDQKTMDMKQFYTVGEFVTCFMNIITALITICILSPPLIVPFIAVSIIFFVVQNYYIKSSRDLKRMESVSLSPVLHCFSECIGGGSIIRAYRMEEYFAADRLPVVQDVNYSAHYWHFAVNRWLGMRLELVASLIILSTAAYANLSNSIWAGLTLSYALYSVRSLTWMVRTFTAMELQMNSSDRILEYTRVPHEAPMQREADQNLSDEWPFQCDLDFANLWLRYLSAEEVQPQPANSQVKTSVAKTEDLSDTSRYVLRGITCHIQPREKIGIVGRTGAGKSSFVSALFRLTEASFGCIKVDGVDINEIGLQRLRNGISIIPQEPLLFHETVRWNLDPFGIHSDSDIWKALDRAHLREIISSLPAKLETLVSGDNFSVGQKQLMCLARVLLRKSGVLIMDEASASLDLETDELIQKTVREAFQESTVLTIAHRIHTIIDSDRIMVLDAGQLVEMDTPRELLKRPQSHFSKLVSHALEHTSPRMTKRD
ncbi:ATP-dependent bile acid permease [Planoprotostelium fungivorum]|uniref:ATP-dependent bile acid permease n=1 Tax=Planoprotostelium fungivorum TaxID=1890364 RepID=A0A2P6NQV3_9EUKA|nr:ATP-dependent bile acid permease [Planoprotostelium fungivorum]